MVRPGLQKIKEDPDTSDTNAISDIIIIIIIYDNNSKVCLTFQIKAVSLSMLVNPIVNALISIKLH